MPASKKQAADRLIVRLLEMKNNPELSLAREMIDSPVIYDPTAKCPLYAKLLTATGMRAWTQAQQNLKYAVNNCLLLPQKQDRTFKVDLEVLQELRMVGFDILTNVEVQCRFVNLRKNTPDEFYIVDKAA